MIILNYTIRNQINQLEIQKLQKILSKMGGKNSKQTQLNFMRDYDIIQQNTAQNITFLQHKLNEDEYLLKQFNFNDKRQSDKVMEKLATLKNKLSGNKHVVPLKDYLMVSEDQYCSTFYKIFALFQYPQRTLDDQICERKLHRKRFSETQLWSILASCIVGLSHLQKNGIKHSALKSNNILLSRQGIIKVSDPFALGQHSNYENALTKRQTKHSYLSPEQTMALQQQIITPSINPFKSDVWTLGMIMLEASFLEYQDDQCYRDEKQRIHWQTVKYNINRLGQSYSNQFKNMIQFMLAPEQKMRPDWVQLENHVMKNNQEGRQNHQQQHKPTSPVLHSQSISKVSNKQPTTIGSNIRKNQSIGNPNIQLSNPSPAIQQTGYKQYPQKLPIIMQSQSQSQSQSVSLAPVGNNYTFGSYQNLSRPLSPRFSNSANSNQFNYTNIPLVSTNPIHLSNVPQAVTTSPVMYSQNNPVGFNIHSKNPVLTNNINYGSMNPSNLSTGPVSLSMPSSVGAAQYSPGPSFHGPMPTSNVGSINIAPLRVSNIDNTRPTRNMFPKSSYTQKTKIDQNIIIIAQDDLDIDQTSSGEKQAKGYNMNIYNQQTQFNPNFNQNVVIRRDQVKLPPNQIHFTQQQNIQKTIIQPQRFSSYSSPGQFNTQIVNNGVQHKQMRPFTINNNQFNSPYNKQITPQYPNPIRMQAQKNSFANAQHHLVHAGANHSPYPNYSIMTQPQTSQNVVPQAYSNFPPPSDSRAELITQEFKYGSKYIGYKLNGMRHGYGKFYYQDGGMYDGNWKQNRMQGFGKLYYQSGKLAYEGEWRNDQFTGKGKIHNQFPQPLQHPFDCSNFDQVDEYWTKYEGQFIQDQKNGKGTLFLSNGERFEGYFKGDCVDGPGVFFCNNGSKINGVWVQNKKVK